MKILALFICVIYSLMAQEIVLKTEGKFKLSSSVHLVDDIAYRKNHTYRAFIEIPSGTTAKWEVDHQTGDLNWEFKNGVPREVHFLGYPGNYGFIPQTILNKKEGGDGDPLDVIVLGTTVKRGTVQNIKILGSIMFLDEGEQDDKMIAVSTTGPFAHINTLAEMMTTFPGSVQIVRLWFEGYDKGSMQFMGYMKRKQAEALIDKAHLSWSKQRNVH